jgi:hypothetical protein
VTGPELTPEQDRHLNIGAALMREHKCYDMWFWCADYQGDWVRASHFQAELTPRGTVYVGAHTHDAATIWPGMNLN